MLIGLHTGDDAGVRLLDSSNALVQTVDFISPVVDDPYAFGQIAAANSLSDVYAMGGTPITALNVLAFPCKELSRDEITAILQGGADKVAEAGGALLGGHTVESPELFYGLSVTGLVDPAKLISNANARPGDNLILTKPLGAGMVSTAVKGGLASPAHTEAMVKSMATLNKKAAEAMVSAGVRCATDVTGFGLIGHAAGIARESKVNLIFDWERIPLLPGAKEAYSLGMVAAGAYANREKWHDIVEVRAKEGEEALLYASDPQTSGGLLISVSPHESERLLEVIISSGTAEAAIVGEVAPGDGSLIIR